MKNLHITCDNLEQRQNVFDVLKDTKLRMVEGKPLDEYLLVKPEITSKELVDRDLMKNSEILTYTEFMEKYTMNTLRNKIDEAKKELKVSQRKLSRMLGKTNNYLAEMVGNGCSTAKKNEIINNINLVMRGEVFKSDSEVIAELTEKLSNAQDLSTHRLKALQHQQTECTNLTNANTELDAELNAMRKNAQEADTVLKNTQDDLDYIKAENDQLRKAVSDRDVLNKSLNAENAELAEQLGFKTKAVYELQSKLKSEKRWMIAFIILTLVLFGVLVWGV